MRRLIRHFDSLVRRLQGVFEFSHDPACLLRIRRMRLAHRLVLGERRFEAGAPMLEIHLWNERVPMIPPGGPDLAWAAKSSHRLRHSLRLLAGHVSSDATLHDLELVGGTTALPDEAAALLLRRLGFELLPHPQSLGAFGEFWQNLYAFGLMAAFNPVSLRRHALTALRRRDLWMTMDGFLERYGPRPSRAARG